ncbi:hypothetical protein ACUN90_23890, partial [Escherichia sp. SP-MK2]
MAIKEYKRSMPRVAFPKRHQRNAPLTKVEKRQNRELSIERILIENINEKIKVFKIFSQKYR